MTDRVTPPRHGAGPVTTGAAPTSHRRETTAVSDLTDRQTAMLEFEARWWQWSGAKAEHVADQFGVDLDAYHVELEQLLALDAALDYDRLLVKRLRRQAPQRARQAAAPAPRRRQASSYRGPLYGRTDGGGQ